jgi:hypothetical protein
MPTAHTILMDLFATGRVRHGRENLVTFMASIFDRLGGIFGRGIAGISIWVFAFLGPGQQLVGALGVRE